MRSTPALDPGIPHISSRTGSCVLIAARHRSDRRSFEGAKRMTTRAVPRARTGTNRSSHSRISRHFACVVQASAQTGRKSIAVRSRQRAANSRSPKSCRRHPYRSRCDVLYCPSDAGPESLLVEMCQRILHDSSIATVTMPVSMVRAPRDVAGVFDHGVSNANGYSRVTFACSTAERPTRRLEAAGDRASTEADRDQLARTGGFGDLGKIHVGASVRRIHRWAWLRRAG